MDIQVLDTPIGFAKQIIEDCETSLKAGNRLSDPQSRYLMLAKAYLERTEELRLARNTNTALQHDIDLYKALEREKRSVCVPDDSPLVSER